MKGQTNQFSNKRVIFGEHSPVLIPKPRLFFQRVTDKKAVGHHPTKEKSSWDSDGIRNTDANGSQSVEETGGLQTFMISFSLP